MELDITRILLVDDDEDDYTLTRDLLSESVSTRYALEWISDYDTALSAIGSCTHHVCLIDYRLGARSGLELIKDAQKSGCQAPLIILTGQGDHDVDRAAMEAGASDYLVKGQLSFDMLDRSVRYAIQQKTVRNELETKERRYRRLVENIPGIVYRSSTVRGGIYYSPRTTQILGYSPDYLIDNPYLWRDSIHPQDAARIDTVIQEFKEAKEFHVEYRIRDWKDDWHWFSDRSVGRLAGNGEIIIEGLAMDITPRKKAEREKRKMQFRLKEARKMQAIATLAGGVAHQFNNALAVITGMLDLLETDPATAPETFGYTGQMKEASVKMVHLTNQLLAYARGGKYRATMLSMHDFIRDTLPLIEHNLPHPVRFEVDLPVNRSRIEADAVQLQMVLSALVLNASEAIENSGEIKVAVSDVTIGGNTRNGDPDLPPGNYARLSVTDNGTGMDQETKRRVFEPFFTTKFQGRGLGLAATYGIVKNHGGHIRIDSEPDRGTTVNLFFPAVQMKENADDKEIYMPNTCLGTVLLIEEDATIRAVMRRMLEKMGCTVFDAKTHVDAEMVAAAIADPIDLVMFDLSLPCMNLKAVVHRIKDLFPDTKILVFSGYELSAIDRKMINSEAHYFLKTPFSLEDLNKALNTLLPN